jgi:hypothetical protein
VVVFAAAAPALVGSETVLVAVLVALATAAALGSGLKVTCAAKDAS